MRIKYVKTYIHRECDKKYRYRILRVKFMEKIRIISPTHGIWVAHCSKYISRDIPMNSIYLSQGIDF